MVSLKIWMRREGIADAEMAERIGGISAEGVRKLRFRARGPSPRVSAAIFALTNGAVLPPDMVPVSRKTPTSRTWEARVG